jgi:hypothetical protein
MRQAVLTRRAAQSHSADQDLFFCYLFDLCANQQRGDMTKLLAGKISTLVAAFTTSLILSGCETATSGRPELCKTNPSSANCAKPRVLKPKAKALKTNERSSRSDSRSDY